MEFFLLDSLHSFNEVLTFVVTNMFQIFYPEWSAHHSVIKKCCTENFSKKLSFSSFQNQIEFYSIPCWTCT